MCQSKAQGGRRCSFHLAKDAGAAMVAYTAVLTGMTNAAVKGAHDDLVAEGAHLPAPEQREVDSFLEGQMFRVRTEPNLTESKREAILRRLRAAIGRVTPSGAQFHAWKNVVAESWARSRRRVAAAFLVSSLMTAGGCAAGAPAQQPSSSPSPSVSVSAPVTPGASPSPSATAPGSDTGSAAVAEPQVDAATLKKHGKADVAKAWAFSTDLAQSHSFNPALMDKAPESVKASDYSAIRRVMTADAQKDFDKIIRNKDTDPSAGAGLNVFGLSGLHTQGWKVNQSKPVTEYSIDGSVGTSPDGNLTTTQRQRATVHLISPTGQAVKYTASKTLTLFVKDFGGELRIDGWQSNYTAGAPVSE